MKKLLSLLLIFLVGYVGITYRSQITQFILKEFVNDRFLIIHNNNIYTKQNTLNYETTTDFYPKNKEDIINIFFTALNGGWENVTFFCSSDYENCINDINDLANSNSEFTKINNFVHPYNAYKRIILNYNNLGKVTIEIERLYTDEEIKLLNSKIEEILNNVITNDMNETEKIKAIHDYIINNTKYDVKSSELIKNNGSNDSIISHKANSALFNGLAICGGYTDAMAIFLNKFDIINYKLISDIHIWNYVYLDNNWYHLDLTWDDPVTDTGEDILMHTFFLITDEKLKELDTTDHNYY